MDVKVAISQEPPVLLDLAGSIARAVEIIRKAAAEGAQLIVFPEAFLPGYPMWVWRLKPGGDIALAGRLHGMLRDNAIDIAGGGLDPIREAAMAHGVVVVVGMNERDSQFSGSTLYNTVAVIGTNGEILNRHRKLMPTNPERMVWGFGDATGLRVVDTPVGRIGCLICWENYMPLSRFALYAQDIDIHIAPTWDEGETWIASMRHIAREGGCWVLSTSTAVQGSDVPAEFPDRDRLYQADEWINSGDAVVVKPSGAIAAGPLRRERDILYATIDIQAARNARRSLDIAGHYGRPDIFKLDVDRRPMPPVSFSDA